MSHAQTATEYLVITAIVIVIAVIVVNVLGVGTNSFSQNSEKSLAEKAAFDRFIQLEEFTVGNYYTTLSIRNTQTNAIQITNISMGINRTCEYAGIPFTLKSGQRKDVVCFAVFDSDEYFSETLNITVVDLQTQGTYYLQNPEPLTGTVPTEQAMQRMTLLDGYDHFFSFEDGTIINFSDLMDIYDLSEHNGDNAFGYTNSIPPCDSGSTTNSQWWSSVDFWRNLTSFGNDNDSRVPTYFNIRVGSLNNSILVGNGLKYWGSFLENTGWPYRGQYCTP